MIREGEAMNLMVELLRGVISLAKVEHHEGVRMPALQIARHVVNPVSKGALHSRGREPHGDDSLGDVGQVEVVLPTPQTILVPGDRRSHHGINARDVHCYRCCVYPYPQAFLSPTTPTPTYPSLSSNM